MWNPQEVIWCSRVLYRLQTLCNNAPHTEQARLSNDQQLLFTWSSRLVYEYAKSNTPIVVAETTTPIHRRCHPMMDSAQVYVGNLHTNASQALFKLVVLTKAGFPCLILFCCSLQMIISIVAAMGKTPQTLHRILNPFCCKNNGPVLLTVSQ